MNSSKGLWAACAVAFALIVYLAALEWKILRFALNQDHNLGGAAYLLAVAPILGITAITIVLIFAAFRD